MAAWPFAWEARWIWAGPPPVRAQGLLGGGGAPPPESWGRACYLRRAFALERVPESVAARVTADSRFVLYVNGAEVGRGPVRSVPERLAYQDIDLAPFLRAGTNVVAAFVRFYGRAMPWWMPATPSFQLGYGSFAFEAPAAGIVSDRSWKGRPATFQRPQDQATAAHPFRLPPEKIDGIEVPVGWTEAEFDDSDWEPATELASGRMPHQSRVPAEPYTAPEAEELAPQTAIPVSLRQIGSRTLPHDQGDDPIAAYHRTTDSDAGVSGDVMTIYDAGRVTIATPVLEVSGERGAIVDVYAGEELRTDGMVEIRPREYALRYRPLGGGPERFEGFDPVGFRYLAAVARGEARLLSVGATERRYPREGSPSFSCDDERLNRLWAIGARTLDVCATDAFVDCPGREQRAWVGDAYVHSLLTFVTAEDWRLVRRHLRIAAHSRRRDGLLAMVAAGDFTAGALTIPDYSLHWLRSLARYFEHSGDAGTVRELLPVAAGIVAAFERFRAADSLLRRMPGWVFVDWAMTERSDVVGAIDALYAAALDDYAALLAATGAGRSAAATARRLAERTRRAFELLWDEGRGIYVDAADASGPLRRVSQQTNAMAIVGGCAPPERWQHILDYVLDERRLVVTPIDQIMGSGLTGQWKDPAEYTSFDPETSVVAAQPFFAHFLHQAVAKAGRHDLLRPLCLKWWPQVERGNTTLEEFWDGPRGVVSRAHAWSATPTYDLTRHLLGVRALEPGYQRAEVRPHFGALQRLAGSVPTPHGPIEVDLTRDGGAITFPPGVTGSVAFADAGLPGAASVTGTYLVRRR
jgi:hypothetical protein